MSDIYYCSNAKNSRVREGGGRSSGGNRDLSTSHESGNNAVKNTRGSAVYQVNGNGSHRDANNLCDKHRSQGIAADSKAKHNMKILNSSTTSHCNGNALATVESMNSTVGNANIPVEGQKEFHNIRCARHQHRASSNNVRSSSSNNNNSNVNGGTAMNADVTDSVPCHHTSPSSASSVHHNYSNKQNVSSSFASASNHIPANANSNYHNHKNTYNYNHHNYKHNSNGAGGGPGNGCTHNHGPAHSQKAGHHHNHPNHHHIHHSEHRKKTESVLSADSDLRFTRRKLGAHQKCGCALIAGFLVSLLIVGAFVYIGYTYFKMEPLPDRMFRGKFRVVNEKWMMDLANQKTTKYQQKASDYRQRINDLIQHSDLREGYKGCEILALDGYESTNDIIVHFNLIFDPYTGLVTTSDLLALFGEEFRYSSSESRFFTNISVDLSTVYIAEQLATSDVVMATDDEFSASSSPSPLGGDDTVLSNETKSTDIVADVPVTHCEPLRLSYCRTIGYNITTYPNHLGHMSYEETLVDVIAFRELVDAECFREAFDFICRLLQPPCDSYNQHQSTPRYLCRDYCQEFMSGCGKRLPKKFQPYFDCEIFPESSGIQSCHHKPRCAKDLQFNAQSPRLCDGYADCPDLSDERTCSFCTSNSLYCGRGRACVPRRARCDGKADCPDGSDEKDCLSISPSAFHLVKPTTLVPYLPRFYSEGYAVFSERGVIGKLCAEGLEGEENLLVRQTVAESLCKSLGYESVSVYEVRNDTESLDDYVRVLDPNAPEISFVRTRCPRREVLYVACDTLQCGVQSVLSGKQHLSLPKMASAGDWPWLVALFREDIHVCDGTLISNSWVLTTESCFQGQPRATWMAIFGSVRLASKAPWSQRRRIIGMIKSPVEGSTTALVRLETPVQFSDHVRPICLPDELERREEQFQFQKRVFVPSDSEPQASFVRSRQLHKKPYQSAIEQHTQQQYFAVAPMFSTFQMDGDRITNNPSSQPSTMEQTVYGEEIETDLNKGEGHHPLTDYPLPESAPQVHYYGGHRSTETPQSLPTTSTLSSNGGLQVNRETVVEHVWTNCNTLGWSRQRDHLQRVQLKISDMAACENISIATVNSMCTEATYQKHDCTQEEYAGAPVQCLISGTNQWALVGMSSWRIACGPSGVERPRMYDKISSNTAWIRESIKESSS